MPTEFEPPIDEIEVLMSLSEPSCSFDEAFITAVTNGPLNQDELNCFI